MISLLGKIRRVPQPSDNLPASAVEEGVTPSISRPVRGEWAWSGIWVYGPLPKDQVLEDDNDEEFSPDADGPDHKDANQRHDQSKKRKGPATKGPVHSSSRFGSVSSAWLQKIPGSRPFLYKFHDPVDPAYVLVPSANYFMSHDSDEITTLKEPLVSDIQPSMEGSEPPTSVEQTTGEKIDAEPLDDDKHHPHIHKREEETTFGSSYSTESFTDAGIQYPKRSPVGGCWKGYFENVSKRKDRNTSHVAETFFLFFNATPAPDATASFPDDAFGDSDKEENDLPLSEQETGLRHGLVHVRGTGTNQFGVFEIVGSFNVDTGLLHCQRIYVFTTSDMDGPSSNTMDHRNGRKLRLLTLDCPLSLFTEEYGDRNPNPVSETKTYFTRKRPVSFRRYHSSESDNEDVFSGTKRPNSMEPPRKRLKSVFDIKSNLFASSFHTGDKRQTIPSFSDGIHPTLKRSNVTDVVDSADSSCISLFQTNEGGSPLQSEIVTKKKQGSSKKSDTHRHSSSKNLMIPCAGDPMEARWRAAHFLYYQKLQEPVPLIDALTHTASSLVTKTTKVNFVVYEGEMDNNMRDGYGVCSYNNNFMYIGSWKHNKEHGHGTLMTSDRRRIVYNGEWERGKMNGKGTYYYYILTDETIEDGDINNAQTIGTYEGDFRENSRHGFGKYTFPDGSSYFGDWMNNLPSGRGTFEWADGSMYEGSWRDGKRHGQGILKAADGFFYDGQWVNNAMEGRGFAVYPHGTRYEGSWLGGKREGRGTLTFCEGAIYEGRFRDDAMDGQGTLQLGKNIIVPSIKGDINSSSESDDLQEDWMIPVSFQSDISHIHQKAGFTHEKEIRAALAQAETAKHEMHQLMLDKTSEAQALLNHFSQQLEAKNEIIFKLKKQIESLESHFELIFEGKLQEVRRKYVASEQKLHEEIEELMRIRIENEMKSNSITTLQTQLNDEAQRHKMEMEEMQGNIDRERKQMDERFCQMQKTFENGKLIKILRTMVSDNQKMSEQLSSALTQLDTLSSERVADQEIIQQCRREVELYMQSNDINIELNLALKKENQNLKNIIENTLNEPQKWENKL